MSPSVFTPVPQSLCDGSSVFTPPIPGSDPPGLEAITVSILYAPFPWQNEIGYMLAEYARLWHLTSDLPVGTTQLVN